MSKKTLIVIGNGMVGHHFLEQFVASSGAAEYEIIVFGEEKQLAYDRVHLSEYFAGSTHADLAMGTTDWYTGQNTATTNWCWPPDPFRLYRRLRAGSTHIASYTGPLKTSMPYGPAHMRANPG